MIQDEMQDRTLNDLDVKLPFKMGIIGKWKRFPRRRMKSKITGVEIRCPWSEHKAWSIRRYKRKHVVMGSEEDPKTNLTGPCKLFFAQFMFFYRCSQVSSSTSKPKTFPFLLYINKS